MIAFGSDSCDRLVAWMRDRFWTDGRDRLLRWRSDRFLGLCGDRFLGGGGLRWRMYADGGRFLCFAMAMAVICNEVRMLKHGAR